MTVHTTPLLDDLVLFEHADPGAQAAQLSTNTYAVLADGASLIVDASFEYLLPAIAELAAAGRPPAGLVLSHRHLAGNGDAFAAFMSLFDAPVLMHPFDIAHPQALRAGIAFADITASDIPARFGLDVIHFPGQTEGSIMLYRPRDALLITGDSAMGTTKPQDREGLRRLVRAPAQTSISDELLRRNWERFDLPIAHIAPYHGTPVMSAGELLPELLASLRRPEPTIDGSGRTPG
ncbi:MAG TPA: MBL fold metallo-hydrolase [Solirubrobacteraceae bacterium]|nr:MBL fold metallo-hydrolase [Solirubrobacteraceae bacterium]